MEISDHFPLRSLGMTTPKTKKKTQRAVAIDRSLFMVYIFQTNDKPVKNGGFYRICRWIIV
jgi:hypothetical protein